MECVLGAHQAFWYMPALNVQHVLVVISVVGGEFLVLDPSEICITIKIIFSLFLIQIAIPLAGLLTGSR